MGLAKTKKNAGGRWYLYVLQCVDNTLYTGITNDLGRRIQQHNNGTASRYTRSRLPVALTYQERCLNKSIALKKEYRMKCLSRKEKKEYINKKSKLTQTGKKFHAVPRRSRR
jgi:predicted GIY-YIG superfamily endonuclease